MKIAFAVHLQQLVMSKECNQNTIRLLGDTGLWNVLPVLILDASTAVAESATTTVIKSLEQEAKITANETADESFVSLFLSEAFLGKLLTAGRNPKDSIRLVRVLSLWVSVAEKSDVIFNNLKNRGAYDDLVKVYLGEDILLKMNVMELALQLASFKAGINFIHSSDMLQQLIIDLNDDLTEDVIKVGLLDVISQLIEIEANSSSSLLVDNPIISTTIQKFVRSSDSTKILVGVKAWGRRTVAIGILDDTKLATQVANLMNHLSNTDISVAVLRAWTAVYSNLLTRSDGVSAPVEAVLLETLLPNVLRLFPSRPFPEIRTECYNLLSSVASVEVAMIEALSGLRTFLLDPQSDSGHEVLTAKHKFVKELLRYHSENGSVIKAIGADGVRMLKSFAKTGPFYVTSTEMSVDQVAG